MITKTLEKDLKRLEKLINELTEKYPELGILCFASNIEKVDHIARNLDIEEARLIAGAFYEGVNNNSIFFYLNKKHGFDL